MSGTGDGDDPTIDNAARIAAANAEAARAAAERAAADARRAEEERAARAQASRVASEAEAKRQADIARRDAERASAAAAARAASAKARTAEEAARKAAAARAEAARKEWLAKLSENAKSRMNLVGALTEAAMSQEDWADAQRRKAEAEQQRQVWLRWLTPTATVDDSTAPTSTWTNSATRDADGTTSAWTDADTVDATAADTSWDDSELLDVFGVVNFAELAGFRLGNMLRHVLPGAEFPDVNYNFVVLIGAFPLGDFTAVEGIEYRADLFDIKEGGRNFSPVMLPWGGPNKRGELTLKWGTVVWTTLYDWINDVEVGGSFRREVFVIQLSRDGFPTRLMRFGNCWPIAWKGAELDTQNSNWTMESLTLAYERFNMLLLRGLTTIL